MTADALQLANTNLEEGLAEVAMVVWEFRGTIAQTHMHISACILIRLASVWAGWAAVGKMHRRGWASADVAHASQCLLWPLCTPGAHVTQRTQALSHSVTAQWLF